MENDYLCFKIFACTAPNGTPCYYEVYNSEIIELTGHNWNDLTDSEKSDVKSNYN